MIPAAHLQQWAATAPWPERRQVEQDLVISRVLVDLFTAPGLADKIAFRGGTAIHKLLFPRPLRYSEDIDLVQREPEPVGQTIDAIRRALSWLGNCKREQSGHSVHLVFRFSPEDEPSAILKIKVELNTREHQPLLTIKKYSFIVKNDWYSGSAEIVSFAPAELFGTKLRALLQRNKGRDLFDLEHGLTGVALSSEQVVDCLLHYLKLEGVGITRAEAEQRMLQKLSRNLTEDIAPLLPANVSFSHEEAIEAFNRVWKELVQSMPGNPWKATQKVVSELRQDRIPNLLLGVV